MNEMNMQSQKEIYNTFSLIQSLNESSRFKSNRFSLLHLRMFKDPVFNYKCLKVSGRELSDLPPKIFEIPDLEYLVLSPERESGLNFHLLKVPKNIGDLTNLRILLLDTNELKNVPSEMGNLRNLERLVLSNNLLTTLPSSFSDLQALKHLHLANNYFKDIPSCVYSMLNLEFLDATDNKISEISEDIGALVNLGSLLLLFNLLERIPESITKCVNLKNLWLGNNRLRSLPNNFGDLTKIDWEFHPNSANVDGNSDLRHPPTEVCRQGPDAIRDYFKQNDTPSTENEDAYVVVGDVIHPGSSIGKSSSGLSSEWPDDIEAP